jgi:hypothetical protein
MDFDQTLYIVISSPTKLRRGYSNATVHPSVRPSVTFLVNTLESTWFKGFQPNLVLTKICHPIDFQGHMSKVKVTVEL